MGKAGGSLAALERRLWPLRATRWIPASAGMTVWRWGTDVGIVDGWHYGGWLRSEIKIPAFTGMTAGAGMAGGRGVVTGVTPTLTLPHRGGGNDGWGHPPHPSPLPEGEGILGWVPAFAGMRGVRYRGLVGVLRFRFPRSRE